jgi:hypothetical protein
MSILKTGCVIEDNLNTVLIGKTLIYIFNYKQLTLEIH